MSARILLILLTISMVFNVAVLVGYLQSRSASTPPDQTPSQSPEHAPPPQRPTIERLARELRLNDEQASSVRQLLQRQQQQTTVFNESIAVLRQDLREELRKSEPDLARVRTLLDQESGMMRQRRLAEAELYGEFVGLLNDDQRRRLSDRPAPDQPPAQRPDGAFSPDIIRRFDRNGNGRLDPDEMREARLDLQNRRRELAPKGAQLPPLWPWFDRNGDGELDDAERAAMLEFLREHRPPGAESIRPELLMPPPPSPQRERDGRPNPRRSPQTPPPATSSSGD